MMNQQSILAHVFPEMMIKNKISLSINDVNSFLDEKVKDHLNERDLRVVDIKPLVYGRLGPDVVGFSKVCQGHVKLNDKQLTIVGLSDFSSVRADCCVYYGKWFYEVYLGSQGVMQLGWCTETCRFSEENGVGDTQDSYGFDGNRIKLWNVLSRKYGEIWRIGDVITCCIDLVDGKLEYYRNGVSLGIAYDKLRIGPNFSYYPAVSLSQGDSLTLNFGGCKFLYPVEGYQPIQHQNMENLVKAECIMRYWERLIPITVDCIKSPVGDYPSQINEVSAVKSSSESGDISCQCCCWLIASNIIVRLENLLKERFINETCLIPFLMKFCDFSNLNSKQIHVNLTLEMLWNLLEKESASLILDNLILGIVNAYQCSTIDVGFNLQIKYLHLILAIVKHQKSKMHILESILFEKMKLPIIMHLRIPNDLVLESILSGNYWGFPVCIMQDCHQHKLAPDYSNCSNFTDTNLKNQYVQSVHLIQVKVRELEDIQNEIIIQLLKSDGTNEEETNLVMRTLFLQHLYRYLRSSINNLETVSDYNSFCLMSLFHRLVHLIRHLWKETVSKFPDLPSFEDIAIPVSLYIMPSSNCIQLNSLRIGGRFSQLSKTFKTEVETLLNKSSKKSEKRGFMGFKKNSDSKNVKSKHLSTIQDIILEERKAAISNAPGKSHSLSHLKITSSPSKDSSSSDFSVTNSNSFNFLTTNIRVEPLSLFTGLIGRTNSLVETSITSDDNALSCQLDSVLGDLTSCLELIEAAAAFYYISANDHFTKMAALRSQAHNLIIGIIELNDRISRCPVEEEPILKLLKQSLKTLERKITSVCRLLAFYNAVVFSEEKRDDILWLWTTTLSTLDDSKYDKLYGFLPTYHIENSLNIFRHLTSVFHPTLDLEGLRECNTVLGHHGVMLLFNYRDKRITHSNLKSQILKGIIDVIIHPTALKCLEEHIVVSDVTNFLQTLLTDWADAMIILEKFWKGDGFGFRYQELPHQHLPEFYLRDAVVKTYEKPNPSKVFQQQLKNVLKDNNSIATTFVDLLLTKINWSFSEVVSNMQELNQYKGTRMDRLSDIRFIRTCSLCFDITVSLLRILEMIVTLVPELFVDFSNQHSELFLDRLYSSISQIFNRCLNKGLFHNIINFKINGLDQVDYFPIVSAALGVIVGLILDSPKKFRQISSTRLVEILIKESNFLQQSLDKILTNQTVESTSASSSDDAGKSSSELDFAFNLTNYPKYISQDEIRKVDTLLHMIQKESSKSMKQDDNKEDDLCTICFAHPKSTIFKPCGHSSCKNCITYQMMSSPHCFFCKTKVTKVEDLLGKDLHIKPIKSSNNE